MTHMPTSIRKSSSHVPTHADPPTHPTTHPRTAAAWANGHKGGALSAGVERERGSEREGGERKCETEVGRAKASQQSTCRSPGPSPADLPRGITVKEQAYACHGGSTSAYTKPTKGPTSAQALRRLAGRGPPRYCSSSMADLTLQGTGPSSHDRTRAGARVKGAVGV